MKKTILTITVFFLVNFASIGNAETPSVKLPYGIKPASSTADNVLEIDMSKLSDPKIKSALEAIKVKLSERQEITLEFQGFSGTASEKQFPTSGRVLRQLPDRFYYELIQNDTGAKTREIRNGKTYWHISEPTAKSLEKTIEKLKAQNAPADRIQGLEKQGVKTHVTAVEMEQTQAAGIPDGRVIEGLQFLVPFAQLEPASLRLTTDTAETWGFSGTTTKTAWRRDEKNLKAVEVVISKQTGLPQTLLFSSLIASPLFYEIRLVDPAPAISASVFEYKPESPTDVGYTTEFILKKFGNRKTPAEMAAEHPEWATLGAPEPKK